MTKSSKPKKKQEASISAGGIGKTEVYLFPML